MIAILEADGRWWICPGASDAEVLETAATWMGMGIRCTVNEPPEAEANEALADPCGDDASGESGDRR